MLLDRRDGDGKIVQEHAVQALSSAEQVCSGGSHAPLTPRCVTAPFSGLSDSGGELADLLCFPADL